MGNLCSGGAAKASVPSAEIVAVEPQTKLKMPNVLDIARKGDEAIGSSINDTFQKSNAIINSIPIENVKEKVKESAQHCINNAEQAVSHTHNSVAHQLAQKSTSMNAHITDALNTCDESIEHLSNTQVKNTVKNMKSSVDVSVKNVVTQNQQSSNPIFQPTSVNESHASFASLINDSKAALLGEIDIHQTTQKVSEISAPLSKTMNETNAKSSLAINAASRFPAKGKANDDADDDDDDDDGVLSIKQINVTSNVKRIARLPSDAVDAQSVKDSLTTHTSSIDAVSLTRVKDELKNFTRTQKSVLAATSESAAASSTCASVADGVVSKVNARIDEHDDVACEPYKHNAINTTIKTIRRSTTCMTAPKASSLTHNTHTQCQTLPNISATMNVKKARIAHSASNISSSIVKNTLKTCKTAINNEQIVNEHVTLINTHVNDDDGVGEHRVGQQVSHTAPRQAEAVNSAAAANISQACKASYRQAVSGYKHKNTLTNTETSLVDTPPFSVCGGDDVLNAEQRDDHTNINKRNSGVIDSMKDVVKPSISMGDESSVVCDSAFTEQKGEVMTSMCRETTLDDTRERSGEKSTDEMNTLCDRDEGMMRSKVARRVSRGDGDTNINTASVLRGASKSAKVCAKRVQAKERTALLKSMVKSEEMKLCATLLDDIDTVREGVKPSLQSRQRVNVGECDEVKSSHIPLNDVMETFKSKNVLMSHDDTTLEHTHSCPVSCNSAHSKCAENTGEHHVSSSASASSQLNLSVDTSSAPTSQTRKHRHTFRKSKKARHARLKRV